MQHLTLNGKRIAVGLGGWPDVLLAEAQWRHNLETYAYPVIGNLAVDAIDAHHLLSTLEPFPP